jgi:hypothetical protein
MFCKYDFDRNLRRFRNVDGICGRFEARTRSRRFEYRGDVEKSFLALYSNKLLFIKMNFKI